MEKSFALYHSEEITAEVLLRQLAEAAYTRDAAGDLLTVAEPWDKTRPASLLWASLSLSGECSLLFRKDVPEPLREQARLLAGRLLPVDPSGQDFFRACADLFPGSAAEAEYSFRVPPLSLPEETALMTADLVSARIPEVFRWITDELPFIPGCHAVIRDGYIVSLCRSVRIGDAAEEAGIETLPAYRGQGLAMSALAAWAADVRKRGKTPLYSTSLNNDSSQRIAQKSGLQLIGRHYTLNGSMDRRLCYV